MNWPSTDNPFIISGAYDLPDEPVKEYWIYEIGTGARSFSTRRRLVVTASGEMHIGIFWTSFYAEGNINTPFAETKEELMQKVKYMLEMRKYVYDYKSFYLNEWTKSVDNASS